MLRGEEMLDIRKAYRERVSISELARRTGHDRKTIRKVVTDEAFRRVPGEAQGARRGSKLDAHKDYLLERMEAGVFNAARLLREIRERGYQGGITILRDFMRPYRPPLAGKATCRFETPPGQQAQLDLGMFKYLDANNTVSTVYCFAMTLCYSRMLYVEFIPRSDQLNILRGLRNALEFFGGVPVEALSDNCSSLVLSRDEDGVNWQPGYLRFCEHYGFTPRACRPYRSRTKGKIERPIRYIRDSFWPVNFTDIDDLNRQALAWRDAVANVRVHGTTHEVPLKRWQEENLQPLPGGRFLLEEIEPRRVSLDCFISWYSNRYSVPWNLVGHTVLVRENEKGVLTVEHAGQVVATHEVMRGRYRTVVDRRHYRGIPMGSARFRQTVYAHQLAPDVEVRPLDVYERLVMGR
ncbi:MAG TPA: IS21 family transposase [Firmicutes bacterium]|nr:IS21 family transposase [Bacillota bacterium]